MELNTLLQSQITEAYGTEYKILSTDKNFSQLVSSLDSTYNFMQREVGRRQKVVELMTEEMEGMRTRLEIEIKSQEDRYNDLRAAILKLKNLPESELRQELESLAEAGLTS